MKRRRVWIAGTVLALAMAGGLIVALPYLFRKPGSSLPGPGSPIYETMVSAFFSGVAALDSDANPIARDSLTRATQAVPEEPAAWANLALAQIRLGDLGAAAAALEKAHVLAPESGSIENLLAMLEERRGRFPEVVEHLKRAIERDPKNLKYRYSLFQEMERQGDDDALSLRILGELLEIAPTNLAALLDRARLAAKVGDAQALADVVRRLKEPAAAWPPNANRQFLALEQAVAASNLRLVTTNVLVLRNVLMKAPDYRRSIDAIMLPTGTIGAPLYRFLRLPVPPPTPAPPDTAIAFSAASLGPKASRVGALFLLPNPTAGPAIPLEADGRELRKADGSGLIAPFPGGPVAVAASSHGVTAADWNSDYLPDLVLAGAGGLRLLRQKEGGLFDDLTAQTKLTPETLNVDAFGVWTADIELDGDLDFVVGLRTGPTLVLRNRGDGSFEPTQPFAAIVKVRDFAWADLDHDGDPEAAFLDDKGKLTVLDNERSGRFRPRTTPDTLEAAHALAVADLDGDGTMDLILLGATAIQRLSSRGEGAAWESTAVLRRPEEPAKGAASPVAGEARLLAADVDNNGGMDLVASGPQGTQIWLDDASGGFRLANAKPALLASAVSDLNGDGRLDLAGLSFEGQAIRAVGSGSKKYRWQVIRPRGAKVFGDGRISSFGVGGEVQVRAGLLVQTQTIAGPVVHFGLGDHAGADVARIVWPNGTAQAEFATKADTAIVAEQRLKGSCPFVYAYNGSGIQFVTDFLWRSPLGLRINAQDTAGVSQTEDWVKIRGDQLVPLAPPENEYDIRLTAELWETHYWDHVSLMSVDHPEGTEIFVDERFARKPPALEVQVTSRLRPVISAFDDKQLDVTDRIRTRDGNYLDTFGRGFYQGITRDHWVEVDVGEEAPAGKKTVLVAEGWIHPTDSSINVALGQGTQAPPQGLVLEVPTSDGKWVAARDDLGFPAGKNKTILIDLDGIFRPGTPRKIRLRTNLEIFWDTFSVAAVEDRTVLKTRRIAPRLAQLRHRGYSLMTQPNLSSPEIPRYEILTGRAQRWNDLIGFYTRFGDVAELLEKVDDRYAIVNAGDEVGFRFQAPAPPPSGWVRDFVLIGDGWNKDGDYNTAYSKTVLPLPSHARPAYDTDPGALEDDPVFREHPGDWERYHTRFVTPQIYRDGLRPRPVANPIR